MCAIRGGRRGVVRAGGTLSCLSIEGTEKKNYFNHDSGDNFSARRSGEKRSESGAAMAGSRVGGNGGYRFECGLFFRKMESKGEKGKKRGKGISSERGGQKSRRVGLIKSQSGYWSARRINGCARKMDGLGDRQRTKSLSS